MLRYWYLSRVKDIASDYKMSEGKLKMILFRTRFVITKINGYCFVPRSNQTIIFYNIASIQS